jgi:hypothetical protein
MRMLPPARSRSPPSSWPLRAGCAGAAGLLLRPHSQEPHVLAVVAVAVLPRAAALEGRELPGVRPASALA